MLQSQLANQVAELVAQCATKLRVVAFEAARHIAEVRNVVNGDVETVLGDGRRLLVNGHKAQLALEGLYAEKVADLEAACTALHKLLGENLPAAQEEPAPAEVKPEPIPDHGPLTPDESEVE